MLYSQTEPSLEQVIHPLLVNSSVELFVHRVDLVHPQISGNKWYKLKYNFQEALALGYKNVLSFGGAYSNHLHALAYAGKQYRLKTVGIVRGEASSRVNPTLRDAVEWGMELVFVSRKDYQRRDQASFIADISRAFNPCYLVPEGGSNLLALKGCAEITPSIERQISDIDYLCVPCGTGATLAGLVAGMKGKNTQVLGFCALKGLRDIDDKVASLLREAGWGKLGSWEVLHQFHCGGFAKLTSDLIHFMDFWRTFSAIPLEPIYTGKMFYGIFSLLKKGYFKPGTRIVAVHTGGLQGLRGMQSKMQRLRVNPVNEANDYG